MPTPSNLKCIFNYLHETYNFQKAERGLPICARHMISSFQTEWLQRVFTEHERSLQSGRPGSNCLCCPWTMQRWRCQLTSRCFHFSYTEGREYKSYHSVNYTSIKKQKISSHTIIIRCNTWKHPELVSVQWIPAYFFSLYTFGLL